MGHAHDWCIKYLLECTRMARCERAFIMIPIGYRTVMCVVSTDPDPDPRYKYSIGLSSLLPSGLEGAHRNCVHPTEPPCSLDFKTLKMPANTDKLANSAKVPLFPRFVTKPDIINDSSCRSLDINHRRHRRSSHTTPSSSYSATRDGYSDEDGRTQNSGRIHATSSSSSNSSTSPKRTWNPHSSITDRLPLAASRMFAETIDDPMDTIVTRQKSHNIEEHAHISSCCAKSKKSSIARTCKRVLRMCSKLVST